MSAPRRALAVVAALIVCASPLAAQPSKSAALGVELVSVLEQRQLQNIAAKDPDRPGFFVAASHVPGSQLLVVSARSNAPDYIDYVLSASRYDEAYSSLNFASSPDGKLFVQDMGCDGLAAAPGETGAVDIVYQDVKKMTVFNGDWKKQDLSEQQYKETFEAVDAGYARALSLLLLEAKRPAGQ